MNLCAADLRNAVRLIGSDHDPICRGYRWEICDEAALAQLVAWTMQGHYRHAERVLAQLNPAALETRPSVQQQAISHLQLPEGTPRVSPARWHRDGLVFQHIAWIAAVVEGKGSVAASVPHGQPADKGFDSLLVPLEDDGTALTGIVICEEKATGNPRPTITAEVWPAIAELEVGCRDAELTAELTAILERYNVPNLDQIVTDAHWLNQKAYRVSITIAPAHELNRSALFRGFDAHALGDVSRRRAETLTLPNLRDWWDQFCTRVITAKQTG